jgi:hypothetical protein
MSITSTITLGGVRVRRHIVPEKFCAERCLRAKGYKTRAAASLADSLNFIVSTLAELRNRHRDFYRGADDYILLNMEALAVGLGHLSQASKCVHILLELGVLESDNHYRIGRYHRSGTAKSKGYRITKEYRSKSVVVECTDAQIQQRIERHFNPIIQALLAPASPGQLSASNAVVAATYRTLAATGIHHEAAIADTTGRREITMEAIGIFWEPLSQTWNKKMYEYIYAQLDRVKGGYSFPAPRVMAKNYEKRRTYAKGVQESLAAYEKRMARTMLDLLEASVENRHQADLQAIEALRQGGAGYHFASRPDGKSRLYSNVANLSKAMRPYLYAIDAGQALVEIDIKNSQPLVLAGLVIAHYGPATLPADAAEYVKQVEVGRAYEASMMEMGLMDKQTNEKSPAHKKVRDRFKVRVFTELYFGEVRIMNHTKLGKAFKKQFPSVDRLIRIYKAERYQDFAVALQRAEAAVVIDTVLAQLQTVGIHALTIHDSVLCQAADEPLVRDLLVNGFQEVYGITPSLSPK